MGLILDTSTLVTAERRGHKVRDIFAQLRAVHGEAETGLAAVTLVELAIASRGLSSTCSGCDARLSSMT